MGLPNIRKSIHKGIDVFRSSLTPAPFAPLFMTAHPHHVPKKNSLSISLTESAVFLRHDGPTGRPHRNAETRSSLVRGLLILELAKPTKISSIELELTATAATAWPEGEPDVSEIEKRTLNPSVIGQVLVLGE